MDRQQELIQRMENGETVVLNFKTDRQAIAWAKANGKFIRADRYSKWGNPYKLYRESQRDAVCDRHKNEYLPTRPDLLERVHELKGKALTCHCAPLRCHCDTLKELADNSPPPPQLTLFQ
jgi:hypothetical protein